MLTVLSVFFLVWSCAIVRAMNTTFSLNRPSENKPKTVPTVSADFGDGGILELVHSPEKGQTAFALWQNGSWSLQKEYRAPDQELLVPYSASSNLIKSGVVLLASEPVEYGSEDELLADIQSFIHRYVDVSPLFEKIASYYVLFTWVYDSFNELPYLRLRGEPGSGKTRFLLTVGSLCYKPMFASGASTVSPLFRILDAFKGTLIIDESDFRMTDERAEIVKILNNGNVKGFPVLRSEVSPTTKEFDPRAYAVFGPKLVAGRGLFEDRALESRFLTEETGLRPLREDIPINLPNVQKVEARRLRNKLLLFRFRNLHKREVQADMVDRSIEPRLNQIFVPLLSIIDDPKAQADIRELARGYNNQMINERGQDMEAQVLEVVKELWALPEVKLSVRDITDTFVLRYGDEYERRITAKAIGGVIRHKLGLLTQKSHGVYIIPPAERAKLERLYE